MFCRSNISQNKNQQPIPGDKNVQKEAELEEDRKSVQPMGNEAANAELLNEILNEPEVKNRLEISDENIENFRERPNTGKKKNLNPDKLLRNHLSSGDDGDNIYNINNINNENNIEKEFFFGGNEIRNDDSSSEGEEDLLNINTDPPKEKKKKGKKKPDKEDAKAAIEIAEEIVEDDPDQFPPISTYAPDEDLMAVTGPKKNVKKKGSKSTADEIKPSKAGIDDLQRLGDARWKAEAAERIRKIEDKEKNIPCRTGRVPGNGDE